MAWGRGLEDGSEFVTAFGNGVDWRGENQKSWAEFMVPVSILPRLEKASPRCAKQGFSLMHQRISLRNRGWTRLSI